MHNMQQLTIQATCCPTSVVERSASTMQLYHETQTVLAATDVVVVAAAADDDDDDADVL